MPDESEPPIREFADRGTLWLLEAPENLRDLLKLAAAELADRLDFSRAERINRSFIPDDLRKQEADLLYRVPFQEGAAEALVYLLLEHQSRPDVTMGFRLLSYMTDVWAMQIRGFQDAKLPRSRWRLSPIVPMVFYTGRRKWTRRIGLASMMDLPPALAGYLPQWETLLLQLRELDEEALTQADTPIAWILRALQTVEEPKEEWKRVLALVVRQLDALPKAEQAQWRRAMQYLYMLVRHKRDAGEQDELSETMNEAVEQHLKEVKEVAMTGAQALLEKGKQEGRREMLLELMSGKFGRLPPEAVAKVRALASPQLDAVIKRIITAATIEEMNL